MPRQDIVVRLPREFESPAMAAGYLSVVVEVALGSELASGTQLEWYDEDDDVFRGFEIGAGGYEVELPAREGTDGEKAQEAAPPLTD